MAGAHGAGHFLGMRTTRQILALVAGVLGILLILRGAWGGVWPLSLQLIAGVLLVAFAVLRWRTL
jgi:hypothetical protein